MLYIEDYVVVNKGIEANNNQDNIYINGLSLSEKNEGLNNYQPKIHYINKELTYAVFDGIGGLEKGEYASYISTNILNKNINNKLGDILRLINDNLVKINREEKVDMGSTASIIRINKNKLYISQVGDSPIYVLSNDKFIKIVEKDNASNLLDNYLGKCEKININEKVINIKSKDKILICSDGLSNEVGDLEIEYILDQSDDAKYISDKLLNYALINGGKDNISIITILVKRSYKEYIYLTLIIILAIILLIIFI